MAGYQSIYWTLLALFVKSSSFQSSDFSQRSIEASITQVSSFDNSLPESKFKMQFKNIVAFASLVFVAAALPSPSLNERNDTPGQTIQNQCSEGQTASCCNQVLGAIGVDCKDLDREPLERYWGQLFAKPVQWHPSFRSTNSARRASRLLAARESPRYVMVVYTGLLLDADDSSRAVSSTLAMYAQSFYKLFRYLLGSCVLLWPLDYYEMVMRNQLATNISYDT